MSIDKDEKYIVKLYKYFFRIFKGIGLNNFLSRYADFSLGILLVTSVIDFLPFPYFTPEIERFFSNEAFWDIAVTLWATSIAIILYSFGKLEMRCLGIRFAQVVRVSVTHGIIIQMMVSLVLEMLWLFISLFLNLKITIAAIAVFQLANLSIVLYIVYSKMQWDSVKQAIQLDTKNRLSEHTKASDRELYKWLIVQMVHNMDLSNEEECSTFVEIMIESIIHSHKNNPNRINLIRLLLSILVSESEVTDNRSRIEYIFTQLATADTTSGVSLFRCIMCEVFIERVKDTLLDKVLSSKNADKELLLWCRIHILIWDSRGPESGRYRLNYILNSLYDFDKLNPAKDFTIDNLNMYCKVHELNPTALRDKLMQKSWIYNLNDRAFDGG